jgi:tetratricopeptide (TPR) repeat protein
MSTDRLSHLQNLIEGYYAQLEGKENTLLTIAGEERVRLKIQIREFKKEIAEVEREYWVYWGVKGGSQLEIGDAEAESINAEIVAEVQMLAFNPSVQQHQELVKLLDDIKVELNQPTPAAGKLKAVIPILPGILSYEMDLDTEGLLRRIFPMFAKLGSKLIVITSRKVPADLEERRGNQIDTSIIRIQPVEGISKADSVVLLEDLGAKDHQVDLDWIADRVGGNILLLRLLADYSSKYPGRLPKQPELVTDEAKPIVRLQLEAQSSAAQNLLKRMCVLRIGMDAKALTILRLFSTIKNPFSSKKEAEKQTEALLKALVNSGLVEETYNSSTRESEYKLHSLIAEILQEIFKKEEKQLWLYAAKLYNSIKPPKELRSLADWKFGLEKLHFWWLLGDRGKVIRIVIRSLLPSLGQWSYWGLQQEWCDRILPYTEGSNYRYCLQTLGGVCVNTGKWAEAEDYLQQSLTHAEQADDRAGMASSWVMLGAVANKQGDYDRAEAFCKKSLDFYCTRPINQLLKSLIVMRINIIKNIHWIKFDRLMAILISLFFLVAIIIYDQQSVEYLSNEFSAIDSTKVKNQFMENLFKPGNGPPPDLTNLFKPGNGPPPDLTKYDKKFLLHDKKISFIPKSVKESSPDFLILKSGGIDKIDIFKSENEFMANFIKALRKFIEI